MCMCMQVVMFPSLSVLHTDTLKILGSLGTRPGYMTYIVSASHMHIDSPPRGQRSNGCLATYLYLV